MLKQTLKFSQNDAFIGFHGKQSDETNIPITQLGAVTFKCRDVIVYESETKDRTWKDHVEEFYDEYDILIWLGSGVVGLLLICCISCIVWGRCKQREAKELRQQFKSI